MEPGFSAAGTFFAGQRTWEDVVIRSVARQAGSSLAGVGLALATRGVAQAADIALDRTMAALGKGNPNINIPPSAEHATISAYKPGYWNRQRDGNFVQRLWYETADNAMVWGKSMLFGRQNVAHLGGGRVTERDAVQAIAGTASLFIPEAKAETAVEEAIARETVSGAAKTVTTEMTTVGRWMPKGEYAAMKNGTTVLEGAGGQTFVTQGGPHLFTGAARGAVYVEFQVPTNSLLQGGKQGWLKMLGPNASKSQQYLLQKQGGSLLPQYQNLSPILQIK